MKKNAIQITTKTGDAGESALANGQRLSKASSYFDAIGDLDELNSWLGLIAAELPDNFQNWKDVVYRIQDTLFYLGAEIAESPKASLKQKHLDTLEAWGEQLTKQLEDNWHTKFLLPGGTILGAHCDIARTVCRRAERQLLRHAQTISSKSADNKIRPLLFQYLNRLSDFLYLLRCFLNQQLSYSERQFEIQTDSS